MLREDVSRNFGFLLNDVARLLRTAYDRRIRELGLTRAQWWVLTHVFRAEGITQTELAEVLEVEKPTLGRLLDRLEAKGFVKRQRCPKDRRQHLCWITPKSAALLEKLDGPMAQFGEHLMKGLKQEERASLVRLLDALRAAHE